MYEQHRYLVVARHTLLPQQHEEWFIAALLPCIQLPLMQQRVTSQSEALEIAMRLEALPMFESTLGMDQI